MPTYDAYTSLVSVPREITAYGASSDDVQVPTTGQLWPRITQA